MITEFSHFNIHSSKPGFIYKIHKVTPLFNFCPVVYFLVAFTGFIFSDKPVPVYWKFEWIMYSFQFYDLISEHTFEMDVHKSYPEVNHILTVGHKL